MRVLRFVPVLLLSAMPASAQSQDEITFVKELFAELQQKSFERNREYCGFIGYDADGVLVANRAKRGRADSCTPRWPNRLDVIASYHTHGAYDVDAWSEIPSGDDMESDEADGVDGWVATPGGRFWYIDTEDMVTFQVCGIGCLPQDPNFVPAPEDNIQQSYSYDELVEVLAN